MGNNIIQLMGPSGIGKSSTLLQAQNDRDPGERWIGTSEIEGFYPQIGLMRKRRFIDEKIKNKFIDKIINTISYSDMLPSQKISAFRFLEETLVREIQVRSLGEYNDSILVHDELLLHRAFSMLSYSARYEEDATWYFGGVPAPNAVIIFRADPALIMRRIEQRGALPNCYYGLDAAGIRNVVLRGLRMTEIAESELRRRGMNVTVIEANGDVSEVAGRLRAAISDISAQSPDMAQDIKDRLFTASATFRVKSDVFKMSGAGLAYCSFHTPKLQIGRNEARRDAPTRLARFGLTPDHVEGKTALDLGCNVGAMLFELNNFGLKSGVGIEYDQEKVNLGKQIAKLSDIANLHFEQHDIDFVDPDSLGVFDIVLALAIESHVQQPDRLYSLLGIVTGEILFFEGNSGCNIDFTTRKLLDVGFRRVEFLGLCDDDSVPKHNKRPLLIARK